MKRKSPTPTQLVSPLPAPKTRAPARPLTLVYADPETLRANPAAWRTHSEDQADVVSGLIEQVNWADALLLNDRQAADGWPEGEAVPTLLDGHLLKTIGYARGEQVPVLVGRWGPEQERIILLTLDPVGNMADQNRQALAAVVGDLGGQNEAVLAVLESQFGDLVAQLRAPALANAPEPRLDEAKALQRKWGTKPGQLWVIPSLSVLGQGHRLLCGDCTLAENVIWLMAGERAELFSTDPPYLVNYDGSNHPHVWSKKGRANKPKDWSAEYHDWDKAEQGEGLYDGFIQVAKEHAITERAAWYCWHASRNQAMVEAVWNKHGAFVHQTIIWVKDRGVLTRGWYLWQHEPCFFGWLKGKKPKRATRESANTVWQFPTNAPGTVTIHPTSKPLELFTIPMQQHTRPGDLCYEPFSGSGSQLLAAEIMGRRCYATEREPLFVAVALQRLEDAGLKPYLEESNGNQAQAKRAGRRAQGQKAEGKGAQRQAKPKAQAQRK